MTDGIQLVPARRKRTRQGKPRHLHVCLRCGYEWRGYKEHPGACARCHTTNWDSPPTHYDARTPADEPSPKWRKLIGRRRKKSELPTTGVAELADARPGEHLPSEGADRGREVKLMANSPSFAGSNPAPGTTTYGLTPPPSLQRGLTPPPRMQLGREFSPVEVERTPEQATSHAPEVDEEVISSAPEDIQFGDSVREGEHGASDETSASVTEDEQVYDAETWAAMHDNSPTDEEPPDGQD